jgi:hypothetical protein
MLCQIIQSELGYADIRDGNFLHINFRNNSYIWKPGDDGIGKVLSAVCPDWFKTVPYGQYAGQEKYWPWVWMIFPVFIYVTPLSFALCMIFDRKTFVSDVKRLFNKISNIIKAKK